MWPTPVTTDAKQARNVGTAHSRTTLTDAMIEAFAATATRTGEYMTPSASRFGSRGNGNPGDEREVYANAGTPSLETAARLLGGFLNPDWVECLMGVPPGWSDVSPSEARSLFEVDRAIDRSVVDRFPAGVGLPPHDWEPPRVVRVQSPTWADRLVGIGNGVVPQVGMLVARFVLSLPEVSHALP